MGNVDHKDKRIGITQSEIGVVVTNWELYLDHRDVFFRVISDLRHRGAIVGDDLRHDLILDFIVSRAPNALKTFEPSEGTLPGWLYVVFRRYVLEKLRQRTGRARVLASLATDRSLRPDTLSPKESIELKRIGELIDSMSKDAQSAIQSYFEANGSIRAVARALGVSRDRAKIILLDSVSLIVQEIMPESMEPPVSPIKRRRIAAQLLGIENSRSFIRHD